MVAVPLDHALVKEGRSVHTRSSKVPPAAIWKAIIGEVNLAAGAAWLPGSRIIDPVLGVDTVNMTRPTGPVEILLDTRDVIRASSAPRA
jgi:hypothetical protein